MVGSHIAHYQLRRQVGEGGMGVVYEALDERDGQRVAVKIMRAEFTRSREALTRFFNEAKAVNLVEHPGLVRIHEHGQTADGTAYLAMEFLQGETLAARLRRYQGPMPEGEARRIAWQLSTGLAAAHRKSIVHRDASSKFAGPSVAALYKRCRNGFGGCLVACRLRCLG
jgi:serine/threonine protein kinase